MRRSWTSVMDWSGEDGRLGLRFGFLRDRERWVSDKRVRSRRRRETGEMILCVEAIDGEALGEGEREALG